MKKTFRFIPAAVLLLVVLILDLIFAQSVWNGGATQQLLFLALHFVLLLAIVFLFVRAYYTESGRSGTALPGYWLAHLDKKLPRIREMDMTVGNHGDSFLFITDLHYDANDGHSAGAAEYILSRSSVSKVIIGGDICNGSSRGKQVCIDQILSCRNAFRRINPFYLRGNHDNNTEISARSDASTISDSELYGLLLKPIENRIVSHGQFHYYFDNEVQRIRYICLDTGHPDSNVLPDAQIAWMQDVIRELDAGWTVIVLTHQYYSPDGAYDGNGEKILAGLNAVYDEVRAAIACVICGHCHTDRLEITEKGFPVIATTCDCRGGEDPALKRIFHTCSEQAFDVFHIDTAARKIYATRIGAGSEGDRGQLSVSY